MRSRAWYEDNSYCVDGTRHEAVEIDTLLGEMVGYMCIHCYERLRLAKRGLDLYIDEKLVKIPVQS